MKKETAVRALREALRAANRLHIGDGRFNFGSELFVLETALASILDRPISIKEIGVLLKSCDVESVTPEQAVAALPPLPTQRAEKICARIGCSLNLKDLEPLNGEVGDATFTITPADDAMQRTHRDAVELIRSKRYVEAKSRVDDYPSAIMELKARLASEDTVQKLHLWIQAIGGAIELAFSHGTLHFRSGAGFAHSSNIGWGCYVPISGRSGDDSRELILSYPTTDGAYPTFQPKRPDENGVQRLTQYLSGLKSSSKVVNRYIASCFLYQAAAEEPSHADKLLHYWQILEEISLSANFAGRTDEIAARIAKVCPGLAMGRECVQATLEYLADMRNDFVHRGRSSVDANDVLVLKIIVDHALHFLRWAVSRFQSDLELDWYFRLRGANNADLEAIQKVATLVASDRKLESR